jgi:hypothetical protein
MIMAAELASAESQKAAVAVKAERGKLEAIRKAVARTEVRNSNNLRGCFSARQCSPATVVSVMTYLKSCLPELVSPCPQAALEAREGKLQDSWKAVRAQAVATRKEMAKVGSPSMSECFPWKSARGVPACILHI